jgi:hypothetical protein
MKTRPILMSAPMVRAILARSKTQTRRVVKPQPYIDEQGNACWNGSNFGQDSRGPHIQALASPVPSSKTGRVRCPYGQPGDRLWVRETWYCDDYRVQRGPYLKPDDMDLDDARQDGTLIYRASSGDRPYEAEQPVWKPAIHMPRWASRITLELTGVRVERLQDISEADALAEGISKRGAACHIEGECTYAAPTAVEVYRQLWESINGAGSWDVNPWVWCVDFRRVT